jgi:hypothetical protein
MSRSVAVIWHALFCIVAGVLYLFFVLPRWPELMGDTPHALGTAMRIVAGALIGLAALPVVFTLLRSRRPELGTPQLALRLRTWSIILQVLASALIIGAAISEIWLSLDNVGQWLFGIYGAAAAIALLGILAFYLAYVAELPPPPPKPLKVKQPRQRRRGRKRADEAEDTKDDETATEAEADQTAAEADADQPTEVTADQPTEVTAEESRPTGEEAPPAEVPPAGEGEPSVDEEPAAEAEATNGKLRTRRPSGKTDPTRRRRRRLRGGVAVED